MLIGACRLTFHLPGNDSLKGKRQVSRSVIDRLHQRFNVAAAEVDANDRHQTLVIGVACVSNDAKHAGQVLDAAVQYVRGMHIDADLVDVERNVLDGD